MSKSRSTSSDISSEIRDYRHDGAKRKNNPPAGMVSYEVIRETPRQQYAYDPHLSPQLVWANKAGLKNIEVEEATSFEVETVSLHIHERISTQAILRAVQKQPKQLELFADPKLPLYEAVEFYQHDMDWTNRLILGDSLLVMNSLLQRELMAGKVQMIYMDPPYGIKFSSNFQPRIDQRDVKDDDESLTREPEQIKAYRDTWTLGVHSYLSYLRDRLILCRELLHESGSIFVQISDENIHRVRCLMDEVFGEENFIGLIVYTKTGGLLSNFLSVNFDFIIWYGKNKKETKFHQLYLEKTHDDGTAKTYTWLELRDGSRRGMTKEEKEKQVYPEGARIYKADNLTSQGNPLLDFEFDGKVYRGGWKTTIKGMENIAKAKRIHVASNSIMYVRYIDDFAYIPVTLKWDDTSTGSFTDPKIYVVQTSSKAVARCILMTTDPGDLVFDPTCGSGTTAYVAEQWGRRWITCDTSRVALALARQRLLTATYPYYKIADEARGVAGGFIYKTVPHITLKSIAQNEPPQTETLFDQPEEDKKKVRVSGPSTVEAIPPPSQELMEDSPIGGAPEAVIQPDSVDDKSKTTHIGTLIELLRKDGVTFPNNQKMTFASFTARSGGVLHAEGEPGNTDENGVKRVAVSFGPLHGPVTSRQVEDGIREANLGGFDAVIFCGFSFDGTAQTLIDKALHPRVKIFMAHIRPDVLMADLLKTTASSQLFTVFGEPDIEVEQTDGEFVITLRGVDVFDPVTGEVHSANAGEVAAWFIDTDYDGRTFCVCQAFFPDKSAWEKLQRALKGTIDEEKFNLLTGVESLPFPREEYQRAAVKVIDHRGNEVMRVVEI